MRDFPAFLALYAGLALARDAGAAGRTPIIPPPKMFEGHLRVDSAPAGIDLDGRLTEWPPMATEQVQSLAGPGVKLELGMATSTTHLFVGARVSNRQPPVPREERIEVELRFMPGNEKSPDWSHGCAPDPTCGDPVFTGKVWTLWLKIPAAGGASAAESQGPGGVPTPLPVARVQVQARAGGFEVEASVPWSAIRPAAEGLLALRASGAYWAIGWKNRLGQMLRVGNTRTFAPLPVEQQMMARLDAYARQWIPWRKSPGLWNDSLFVADLFGDARKERIGTVHNKVTVCRSEGTCQEIEFPPIAGNSLDGLVEVEARNVTGREKAELVVTYVKYDRDTPDGSIGHSVLEIWSADARGVLAPIFRHEIAVFACCPSEMGTAMLSTDVNLERGVVEIRARKPFRWSRKFRAQVVPLGGGILPPVLPWDRPPVRRYRWQGDAFVAAPP
jgi:hypothetical protein